MWEHVEFFCRDRCTAELRQRSEPRWTRPGTVGLPAPCPERFLGPGRQDGRGRPYGDGKGDGLAGTSEVEPAGIAAARGVVAIRFIGGDDRDSDAAQWPGGGRPAPSLEPVGDPGDEPLAPSALAIFRAAFRSAAAGASRRSRRSFFFKTRSARLMSPLTTTRITPCR
jgi:hypothetical protein